MSSTVTLRQTKTIELGPAYVVKNEIISSTDIQPELFVHEVLTEAFSYVATVWDLQQYPVTKAEAEAESLPYYLDAEGTKSFSVLQDAVDHEAYVVSRLTSLLRDYDTAVDEFEGIVTTVIP
jgi:hypothetical protein